VDRREQDELYGQASTQHGTMIRRLARGYEADPEHRLDLLQEIHLNLWQSLRLFDGRCALRTWVYRIAHNVAASHILRQRRFAGHLVDLEALDIEHLPVDDEARSDYRYIAQTLLRLIHRLRPADRQIILLYLEGETATDIAEVTGLSPSNIATKIHRIKKLLHRQYIGGESHEQE
jgi:RNA polymerase sigma-70 factor (ECF subfamily)